MYEREQDKPEVLGTEFFPNSCLGIVKEYYRKGEARRYYPQDVRVTVNPKGYTGCEDIVYYNPIKPVVIIKVIEDKSTKEEPSCLDELELVGN